MKTKQPTPHKNPPKPKHKTNGVFRLALFSNYSKARSYALKIKKEASRKLAGKPIDIEPVANGSVIIYRSKIIGLAKSDADKACKSLKRSNKSCIVVAVKKRQPDLVLANSQY